MSDAIIRLLTPIREAFEQSEEWKEVEKLAYPDPNAKPEKKKKVWWLFVRFMMCLSLFALKVKVYHPPPPGKGKNARQQQEQPVVEGQTPVSAPTEGKSEEAKPSAETSTPSA